MSDILVIGEALIDEIYQADGASLKTLVGGSPANVAKGLARLGTSVELSCWLAKDTYGQKIANTLRTNGVFLSEAIFKAQKTSIAKAIIDANGSANYEFEINWHLPDMPKISDFAWIHTGSIATVLEPGSSQILEYLSQVFLPPLSFDPNIRKQIITNPKIAKEKIHRFISISKVVKMSDEDAHWLYPGENGKQIWEKIRSLGVQIFALTKGKEGAEIWDNNGTHYCQSNYPSKIVDTVGAGDSFMSALIYGIITTLKHKSSTNITDINSVDLAKILDFCLQVAAQTVSRTGANPPGLKEILVTKK